MINDVVATCSGKYPAPARQNLPGFAHDPASASGAAALTVGVSRIHCGILLHYLFVLAVTVPP
jgi:hypothetical protein